MKINKKKNHNRSNQTTGVSGEYYVAAELSKRGYIASITLRNTDGIDILASNTDGSITVAIQVKTKSSQHKKWPMNVKHEQMHNPNLFYIFVTLNNDSNPPEYHVVKSKVVAEFIKKDHEIWSRTPKKDGSPHGATDMRQFRDLENKYKDKWKTLGLDNIS